MLGYIIYGDGPKRPEIRREQLLGGLFITLRMAQLTRPNSLLARRRVVLAAGKMREMGVRSAVFPVDFPYMLPFVRQGICPVDTLPLRRALSASLARRQMEQLGLDPTQAVVAIVGNRMSREMMETTKALALSYRYVLLSVKEGGETLARSLRREYGVSLLLHPSREQLERADALLLFSPRGDLSGENRVFYTLYPGGEIGRGNVPLDVPAALAERVEANCDRRQLAAALYAMGTLTLDSILAEIPC